MGLCNNRGCGRSSNIALHGQGVICDLPVGALGCPKTAVGSLFPGVSLMFRLFCEPRIQIDSLLQRNAASYLLCWLNIEPRDSGGTACIYTTARVCRPLKMQTVKTSRRDPAVTVHIPQKVTRLKTANFRRTITPCLMHRTAKYETLASAPCATQPTLPKRALKIQIKSCT